MKAMHIAIIYEVRARSCVCVCVIDVSLHLPFVNSLSDYIIISALVDKIC